MIKHLGVNKTKFYDWEKRYGKTNNHNGLIPRYFWLSSNEKSKIVDFYLRHQDDGYRRCTYMMIDQDIVYCSASTVYRTLSKEGVISRSNYKESSKGKGFKQPLKAHEHWHMDISYINMMGTFYYFISVLDGYSRSIIHWEIRQSMTETDVEIVLQKATELYPEVKAQVISDNGSQFIAKDFKEFIRIKGLKHVRTSIAYPQSNGKIESFHKTLKTDCVRKKALTDYDTAIRVIGDFIDYYNKVRLHSAIDYVTPHDKLYGNAEKRLKERFEKLEKARAKRRKVNKNFLEKKDGNLTANEANEVQVY